MQVNTVPSSIDRHVVVAMMETFWKNEQVAKVTVPYRESLRWLFCFAKNHFGIPYLL